MSTKYKSCLNNAMSRVTLNCASAFYTSQSRASALRLCAVLCYQTDCCSMCRRQDSLPDIHVGIEHAHYCQQIFFYSSYESVNEPTQKRKSRIPDVVNLRSNIFRSLFTSFSLLNRVIFPFEKSKQHKET